MLREFGYSDSRAGLFERASGTDIEQLDEARLHRLRPHVHRFLAGLDREPVFVKTHNAVVRLDEIATITPELTAGAIYVLRDPRDVAVSFADHFALSLDDAVAALCREDYRLPTLGRNVFSQLGSWSQHVASWVDASGLNAHVVRYEDMLAKPRPTFGAPSRAISAASQCAASSSAPSNSPPSIDCRNRNGGTASSNAARPRSSSSARVAPGDGRKYCRLHRWPRSSPSTRR